MSAPIDELLIAVRIEQGSNLMELYEMLRELQDAGGTITARMPSWFTAASYRGLRTRLENIKKACDDISNLFPKLEQALQEFFGQAITDMYSQLLDTIMLTIENKFEPPIDSLRISFNNLENYIKTTLMGELSNIMSKLDKVEIDPSLFENIEKRIAALKKTFIEYGKKITAIKNTVEKQNYKIPIDTNRALLQKIIENKQRFEPEVLGALNGIEKRLKDPKVDIEDLKDFISSQSRQLLQSIPLDLSDYFKRVMDLIDENAGNIKEALKDLPPPKQLEQSPTELPIVELSDNHFDMFNAIVQNIVEAEIDNLDNRLREIEKLTAETVKFTEFDAFRTEFRDKLRDITMPSDRLWSIESSLVSFAQQLREFNKERRWQSVVKEMLDRHFPNMEEKIADKLKEEINTYFDQEFNELYRVLRALNSPEAMEELEEGIAQKELERDLTSDLYDAMTKYEEEEKKRYLRGEGTTVPGNLIFRGTDFERQLNGIDDKLDEALDSLDDINPRGDEAQRTLDRDKEKANKRRDEPL